MKLGPSGDARRCHRATRVPVCKFRTDDDATTERAYPVGAVHPRLGEFVPDIGKCIGVWPDRHSIEPAAESRAPMIQPSIRPYRTVCLPKNTPGFQHDADGNCIVETRRQERDFAKATGLEWN